MTGPPKRIAPALGVVTEAGAETTVGGVRAREYQDTDSPAISVKQERGFVRQCVDPEPVGGFRLAGTYSSLMLAEAAAERLQRERGRQWDGGRHG